MPVVPVAAGRGEAAEVRLTLNVSIADRMRRTKISIVGKVRFTEGGGLQYSLPVGDSQTGDVWLEVLADVNNWPGLGRFPEQPQPTAEGIEEAKARKAYTEQFKREVQADMLEAIHVNRAERNTSHAPVHPVHSHQLEMVWQEMRRARLKNDEETNDGWRRACEAYMNALHADAAYLDASRLFLHRQELEPQALDGAFWAYRGFVVSVNSKEPVSVRDPIQEQLLVKQHVLRRERTAQQLQREVESLESISRVGPSHRLPIPEQVRLFVWQRDKGACVQCGTREKLEFDHIIPLAAGGSSTERNIQLLCERCNRSKGKTI